MSEEWQQALRGELARDAPRGDDASAVALRAARWAAGLDDGALPEPSALVSIIDERDGARAAWIAARVALVRRDATALSALAAIAREGGDAERGIAVGLIHAAHELARGMYDDAAARAIAIERAAHSAGCADHVVEAASIAALARLAAGAVEEARGLARRASRMARTESMPQPEYLAHTVLARVRRAEGRAYLATRILLALARFAPRPWGGWLALELALAGETEAARSIAEPSSTAALLLAAFDAPDAALRTLLAQAEASASGFAPIARELAQVRAAIDPEAPVEAEIAAWRVGKGPLPAPLLGLSFAGSTLGAPLVVARPDAPAVRVLPHGARLAPYPMPPADAARQLRTERAAAELALAGRDGLAREDLFARLYGFAFRPATHQGVLDVLMHRVRERVAGLGAIERDAERVRLILASPALFLDEPAERPIADLALRALARRPGATAREVAEELAVALRTVQTALSGLVDEGACDAEKRGRLVGYRVEDTTFLEPSRVDRIVG